MEQLKAIGIDIGLLISGLFGAILLMSKNAAVDMRATILSITGGAASANYMTPILLDLFKLDTPNANYGIAFLLGFLGLKGIEMVTEKLFGKKIIEAPSPQVAKKPRQRKTPVRRK